MDHHNQGLKRKRIIKADIHKGDSYGRNKYVDSHKGTDNAGTNMANIHNHRDSHCRD